MNLQKKNFIDTKIKNNMQQNSCKTRTAKHDKEFKLEIMLSGDVSHDIIIRLVLVFLGGWRHRYGNM